MGFCVWSKWQWTIIFKLVLHFSKYLGIRFPYKTEDQSSLIFCSPNPLRYSTHQTIKLIASLLNPPSPYISFPWNFRSRPSLCQNAFKLQNSHLEAPYITLLALKLLPTCKNSKVHSICKRETVQRITSCLVRITLCYFSIFTCLVYFLTYTIY